jgi:hypothetical protein
VLTATDCAVAGTVTAKHKLNSRDFMQETIPSQGALSTGRLN